jgi:flagellar capping protein FliD
VSNISFSGVGTGIDWNSVIQAQIQARTQVILTPLQKSETTYQNQLSAYDELGSLLSSLQSAVQAMDTSAELRSYTVSSSSQSDIAASVSTGATAGSHSVVVNQLAAAEVEIQAGVDDATTVVNNSGSNLVFAYSYAGKSTSVLVSSGTTLQQLANLINKDADNPGVTASILDDGSGGPTSHHLVLRGSTLGAANTIEVGPATTLAGEWANLTADAAAGSSAVTVDSAASFHQYQAVMLGDADSPAEYHVIDSIAGTTLNLKDALGSDFTMGQNAYVTAQGSGSAVAGAASTGSAQLTVADVSGFQVGKSVIVADANGSEELTISGIDSATGTLTFSSNLANDYAADAYVTQVEGGRKFTFGAGDFTQVQAAANAQFRVDGYPPSGWLQRSSNVVADVIPGVTLTLTGTNDAAPVTVTVSPDVDGVKEKINEFVSGFNAVKSFLNTNTTYDPDTKKAGVLQGSYAATMVEQRLQDILVSAAPGFQNGADAYTQLGQVGIDTVAEGASASLGTLSVDDGKLTDALNTNFDAVIRLFSNSYDGYSSSKNISFYQAIPQTTQPGQYDVQADFDASGNLTAARIRAAGDAAYRDASIDSPYIYGQFGTPESGLWMRAQWDGTSTTESATIRVTQGKAGQVGDMLSQVLDSSNGLLHNIDQSYQNMISGLDDRIATAQTQLNDLSDQLKTKYALLENTLVQMQARQQWITSMASSLSSSS